MGQQRIQNSSDFTLRTDVWSGLENLESLLNDDDKSQDVRRRSANAGTIRKISSMSVKEGESSRSPRRHVSFSKVEIQEYAIELGDNPATAGVPITIGWKPQFKIDCDIEEYERLRPPSRRNENLSISSDQRVDLLHKQGTSMREILQVKAENQKIRRARERSVQSVHWDGVKEALESASRRLKKMESTSRRTMKKVATKSFWMLSQKKTINRDVPL